MTYEIYFLIIIFLSSIVLIYYIYQNSQSKHKINPPKLENNPSWDVIVTELHPMLTFYNSQGGPTNKTYEIEIDTSKNFSTQNLIKIYAVKETTEFITNYKLNSYKLIDKTQYYWRARTIAHNHKSDWTLSRFFVDTNSDKKFENLVRANIENIYVSGGYNSKNIIDYDDPGLVTFWQSPPPGDKKQWVLFDLGKTTSISRIWILSNPNNSDGWLKHFHLESSIDGKKFNKIQSSEIKNNDTFRNIIDFKTTNARFFKLVINDFIGYAAQINEIILFSPQKPKTPTVPKGNYVLIIGNEHNGFTFTPLENHIKNLGLNLKTIVIPYFEASFEMLEKLPNKPLAIILSGNNADYPNLPMFEYNGEFEIIRKSNIPILGICAGHQFLSMAYGYTRAASMGWSDISAMELKNKMTHIEIIKNDSNFKKIKNNFTAPEVHGWAVMDISPEFELLAKSTYIQSQKNTVRNIYGIQFHSEINVSYNEGKPFIKNFLTNLLNKK